MARNNRVRDLGSELRDESLLGEFNHRTQGIVMDAVMDTKKQKKRIKVMRTEKIKLLAGESTIAVFWIKGRRPVGTDNER